MKDGGTGGLMGLRLQCTAWSKVQMLFAYRPQHFPPPALRNAPSSQVPKWVAARSPFCSVTLSLQANFHL